MNVKLKVAIVLIVSLSLTSTAWANGPDTPDLDNAVSGWWQGLLSIGEETIELVVVFVSDLAFSETSQDQGQPAEPCGSTGCLEAGDDPTQDLGGHYIPIG